MFIICLNILDDFLGFYNDTNVSASSPMATNIHHGIMVRTNVCGCIWLRTFILCNFYKIHLHSCKCVVKQIHLHDST